MNATTHQTPNSCFIATHTMFHLETDKAVEKRTKNLYRVFHIRKLDTPALSPFIEGLNCCVKCFMHNRCFLTAIERNAIQAVHHLIEFGMALRELPVCLGHADDPLLIILSGPPCCFEG